MKYLFILIFATTAFSAFQVWNLKPIEIEEILVGAPVFNLFRDIGPITDSTYDLGSSTAKWDNLYVNNASTSVLSVSRDGTATTTISSATSTFANGLQFTGGSLQLLLTGCNGASVLETDASGNIQCGTDSGGTGFIQTLNSLGGADQTLTSNNGLLKITSSGTDHLFEASSTPTFSGLTSTGTLMVSGNATTTNVYVDNTLNIGTTSNGYPIIIGNNSGGGKIGLRAQSAIQSMRIDWLDPFNAIKAQLRKDIGSTMYLNNSEGDLQLIGRSNSLGVYENGVVSIPANGSGVAVLDVSSTTASQLFRVNGSGNQFLITGAGNVGIGTTSPGASLSAQGTGLFTSTTTAPVFLLSGCSSPGCNIDTIDLLTLRLSSPTNVKIDLNNETAVFNFGSTGLTSSPNNTYSLGSFGSAWKNIHASSTLYVSGLTNLLGGLNASSTATSTFANGIKLDAGCFRDVSGSCIVSGLSAAITSLNSLTGSTQTITSGNGLLKITSSGSDHLLEASSTPTFSGITSTSTLRVSGDTRLTNASTTGMLTIGNGFISSASSTISSNLLVSGVLNASSSLAVTGGGYFGGNVGIGTTNPETQLEVLNGRIRIKATTAPPSTTGLTGLGFEMAADTVNDWSHFLSYNRTTSAYKTFVFEGSPLLLNYQSGGKVGIGGVLAPQNTLDVEGAVAVGASYSGTSVAPANGMIIEGKLGIGTTSPMSALAVVGTTTSSALTLTGAGLSDMGSSTPLANTLYKENIPKAWVNFDGTQAAANMIRDAFNVSSITDDGVGHWTINFGTLFNSTNYACTGMAGQKSIVWGIFIHGSTITTGAIEFFNIDPSDINTDTAKVNVVCFGDQ